MTTIKGEVGNLGDASWSQAERLIKNLDNRSSDFRVKPKTATGWADYDSCFVITENTVESGTSKIVFTVDLKQSFFVHAVILAENDTNIGLDPENLRKNTFGPYEIHIGDSNIWSVNPKCADGPFLDPSDPASMKMESNAKEYYRHGQEKFCNMEGQYVTISATLSQATAP